MAYLLAHFTGEDAMGEQVYFSISRDGLHWRDLAKGPVLVSTVGEKGVRDPFLLRSRLNGHFYLLATDLRIANGKGWEVAQYAGSTGIIVWTSADLIHWSGPAKTDFAYIRAKRGGCVWAPEAHFDRRKNAYIVYWASMVDRKQRIYAAMTRDFSAFSDFRPLIEKEGHVIDTTYAEENGRYYRFSAENGITMATGNSLEDPDFAPVTDGLLPGTESTEGPVICRLDGLGQWCLYVDDIGNGGGYVPFLASRLADGAFTRLPEGAFDMGARKKRHGSILSISSKEYAALAEAYGFYQ